MTDVLIVGAGLTGLRLGQLLQESGTDFKIIEARKRFGGRILSKKSEKYPEYGKFDLGPTWFWSDNEPIITNLVEELQLETFPQYDKGDILLEEVSGAVSRHSVLGQNSMRINGGIGRLAEKMFDSIAGHSLVLHTKVTRIEQQELRNLKVTAVNEETGAEYNFNAKHVILAMPPRLAASDISFSPQLSPRLRTILEQKNTWMADQAKIIILYDTPFWRKSDLSGSATSWGGPLREIHDASPSDNSAGALCGFFGFSAEQRLRLSQDEIFSLIREQVVNIYGHKASYIKDILYKDWSEDASTAARTDAIPMKNFPVYGDIEPDSEWAGLLTFSGTETVEHANGHLEGALEAAGRAFKQIKSSI